jgi:hypothetical protein
VHTKYMHAHGLPQACVLQSGSACLAIAILAIASDICSMARDLELLGK